MVDVEALASVVAGIFGDVSPCVEPCRDDLYAALEVNDHVVFDGLQSNQSRCIRWDTSCTQLRLVGWLQLCDAERKLRRKVCADRRVSATSASRVYS